MAFTLFSYLSREEFIIKLKKIDFLEVTQKGNEIYIIKNSPKTKDTFTGTFVLTIKDVTFSKKKIQELKNFVQDILEANFGKETALSLVLPNVKRKKILNYLNLLQTAVGVVEKTDIIEQKKYDNLICSLAYLTNSSILFPSGLYNFECKPIATLEDKIQTIPKL